jgi:NADPH-dependent curcumin reductase CurA
VANRGTRSIYLTEYVRGGPLAEGHFAVRDDPLPPVGPGQLLLETMHLSIDPYMRGCMTGLPNYYLPQYELDQPIYSVGIARVAESRHPGFTAGEVVTGTIDWSERSVWRPAGTGHRRRGGPLRPVPPATRAPLTLGVLGTNGLTAFFGVLAVARPRPGESMLISSAAGGVGSVAGQIAKIRGARVIGLCGSPAKCRVLTEQLGFDAAVSYRSPDWEAQLRDIMPAGPDIYFDCVGGRLSQAIMAMMRRPARVIECGQISTYDDQDGGWQVDIRPIHQHGLTFEGFTPALFTEFEPAALAQLSHWVETGKLTVVASEYRGLGSAPSALIDILHGGNVGKAFVTLT